MDFLRRLQGNRAADRGPSIVAHLRAHRSAERPGIEPEGQTLPDESDDESRLRWAPGALDHLVDEGRLQSPTPATEAQAASRRIYLGLRSYAVAPSTARELDLRRALDVPTARELAGELQRLLDGDPIANRSVAHELVRRLVETSARREPLKLAIVLLGFVGDSTDTSLLSLLAMHGEFTTVAAAAIARLAPDPAAMLLEVAPGTVEWGRVSIIRALLRYPTPTVRRYLVRDALRGLGSDLDFEVGLAVANECRLDELIADPGADEEDIRGVGLVLSALASAPRDDLSSYADGAAVTTRFLERFADVATTLSDHQVIRRIRDRAASAGGDGWPCLPWSDEARDRVVTLADGILNRPSWRDRVLAALDDPTERQLAAFMAPQLGVPIRSRLIGWLRADPLQPGWWYLLCERPTEQAIDEVLALAREVLKVEAIANGPSNSLGGGPQYLRHQCVDFVAQALRGFQGRDGSEGWPGFPGRGEDLLYAALRSPIVRNRHLALDAVIAWPPHLLTLRLFDTITAMAAGDPSATVRRDAAEFVARTPRPFQH